MREMLLNDATSTLIDQLNIEDELALLEQLADPLLADLDQLGPAALALMDGLADYLDDEEFVVLQHYFGLDGSEPLDPEKISLRTGLDYEEVEQLKEQALGKLRQLPLPLGDVALID